MKLKISIALAILFVKVSVWSQDSMANVGLYSAPPIFPVNPPVQSQQKNFTPKDPFREIDGKFYSAATMSEFYGTVLEVQPTGIRVQGIYGKPGGMGWNYGPKGVEDYGSEFFVEGYPYEVAENDFLAGDMNLAAKEDGVYAYTTTQGGSRTIHKLVYGKVYHPPPPKPPTPEEIAAAKIKADAAKKSSDEKALKYNQDQADKGDAYGLLRMGERYRDGDGVPKDLVKARDYFSKAVAAGSPSAADELLKMNQDATATKQ
jgi:hypothetical protein